FLLAPVVRGRKGEYRKELLEWQKAGFTRVRVDGEFYDIEETPKLDKKYKHDIEVVVDRLVVRDGMEQRLADSFETALRLADGLAVVDLADGTVDEALAEAGRASTSSARTEANGVAEAQTPFVSSELETRLSTTLEANGKNADSPQGKMKGTGLPDNRIVFSERFACPVSGFTIEEIAPRLFSFN
ncbi:unnamed protein product, partial [Laminaria digitata]